MDAAFSKLLEVTLMSSVIAAVILLLRAVCPRLPRGLSAAMWAVLGARLLLPFSVETEVRLLTVPKRTVPAAVGYVTDSGVSASHIACVVWLLGAAACLFYMLLSWLLLRRRTREGIPDESGALLCDRIPAPFVMGVFRPRVCLPSGISQEDKRFVLLHEQSHIARHDNVWKPLGFLAVCLHWFNPLVWLAFRAFSQDIETACDAHATRGMSAGEKKQYALALVRCSVSSPLLSACPVAFAETSVKRRVRQLLSNRRTPVILSVLVGVLALCVTVFCFTVPKAEGKAQDKEPAVQPVTTIAPTEKPTQPPTRATEPETAPATAPATEPETDAPTEPPAPEADDGAEEQESEVSAYADEETDGGDYAEKIQALVEIEAFDIPPIENPFESSAQGSARSQPQESAGIVPWEDSAAQWDIAQTY